jgi:hypothetical protein
MRNAKCEMRNGKWEMNLSPPLGPLPCHICSSKKHDQGRGKSNRLPSFLQILNSYGVWQTADR